MIMRKILICVHNLSNGGAERVASLWAKGFTDNGDIVHIVTCDRLTPANYIVPDSVMVHDIDNGGIPLLRYMKKALNLRKILKEVKPDVAIAVLNPWNLLLIIASVGLRVPIVNTEHNSFETPPYAPMPRQRRFEKFVLNRLFDRVTLLTEADKEVIGNRLKNICILPNPLAFEPIVELPKKRSRVIIAAGRLDAWFYKGFDILIRVWGVIAEKFPEWNLLIAGNGKDEDLRYLMSVAATYNVDKQVRFLGFCQDLASEFRKAEIFVLSSRYEAFGMVLIEAMSQGCACIACDYKGRQSEIIANGINGLLCQPNDDCALAQCMSELLTNDSKRSEIQRNAIYRSSEYQLPQTIKRWEVILEEMGV